MVDYSYVELSSTCIRTLIMFKERNPNHRTKEIENAVQTGIQYIKSKQLHDGSFYGSWASCFSYAGWFAAEALVSVGEYYQNSEVQKKLAQYFLSKQSKIDGGWGEDFNSCRDHVWVEAKDGSQKTHTAWVCLALMRMKFPDVEVIKKKE